MIKKSIYIPIIFTFLISNANAEELNMNDLLKDGYKVIKEELIEQDSVPRAIKIFTLRKNKEIKMCSTIILSNGSLISRGCKTP